MKIKIKNISGIQDEDLILNEGLSVIRAPNAVGKTSLINSLKVTTMPEKELKTHPEFLNDSANDGSVSIEFEKIKDDRKIRRYGNELVAIGNPLFNCNGKSKLLFAEPDNTIIHETIKGASLEPFIEEFSNVEVYQNVNNDVIETIDNLKAYYDDDAEAVSKIKTIEKTIDKNRADREKLSNERNKIKPLIEKAKSQIKNSGKIDEKNKNKNELLEVVARLNQGLQGKLKEKPLLESELRDAEKRREVHIKNKSKLKTEQESLAVQKGTYEGIQEELQSRINVLDDTLNTQEQVNRNTDWTKTKSCPICGRPITNSQRLATQKEKETERKQVNADLLKTENKIKEIENRMNDIEDELNEINDIQKNINQMNLRIAELEKTMKFDLKDVEAKTQLVNKLKSEIKELSKGINQKDMEILDKQGALDESIGETDGRIKGLELELEELSEKEKRLSVLKKKIEFMTQVKEAIKRKIADMKNGVKNRFNLRIGEVYSVLGFKNFDKIFINDSYKIEVVRKGKQQELNRLSTSERITIAVIVMLAGKEEYLPEFPFFVLDEITTAYDPTRFKKIIDYIVQKTKTRYVIVTAFSPTGDKIKIERSI